MQKGGSGSRHKTLARRRAFVRLLSSVDPRKFLLLMKLEKKTFTEHLGEIILVQQFTPKTPGEKWSVLGVVGFHGITRKFLRW